MRDLNTDIKTRDTIIFGEYDENKYQGGIRSYDELNIKKIHELLDKGFINVNERQNLSPTIGKFIKFMDKYPDYKAHGYVVSDKRDDYRFSIEGLVKDKEAENIQELKDFITLSKYADEIIHEGYMWCWWD